MPKAKPSPTRKDDIAPSNSAADLSYNEAHTALQLTLAALQADDVDVEEMTGLYRQASAYLDRCNAVLAVVEQEILLWEGAQQTTAPANDSSTGQP